MGFLIDIFKPHKDDIWKQLSEEIGAKFIDAGVWSTDDKVEVKVKNWIVTLDTNIVSAGRSSVTFTRMRAPYVNRDGFRFKIYRKGIYSMFGKVFGMHDIESGFNSFDQDFVIQGNNDAQVRALFASEKIRDLIEAQPEIYFEVKDDEGWFGTHFPKGVDELCFQVKGVIKDNERLKLLYDLFAETLNQLCHIGSAYKNDPGLKL
jgi:hypothetical protein